MEGEIRIDLKHEETRRPAETPVVMTLERRMARKTAIDFNNMLNTRLSGMIHNLTSLRTVDYIGYYHELGKNIEKAGIEEIYNMLLERGLYSEEITIPAGSRINMLRLLEETYGPLLTNYPTPEGRIYLLYTLLCQDSPPG